MKKILLEYSDISIFVIVVTLIDFLFRKRMGFDIGMNLALVFHFLYLAFFCGLFLLTGKKTRVVLETIFGFVFSFYVFAQTLHFAYFSVFFSVNKIALIQELSGVANSIFGKISFRDFFYFLPAFCMMINALLTRGTFKYSIMKRVAGLILLCISFILISNSYSVIPSDSHWASDMKYNYDNLSNKNKAVQDFGTMTYIHLDTVKTAKKFFKKTDSEAVQAIKDFSDEYFTELSSNEMSSVFEGKNLILIQCESLANLAVNETVMPTVSKMAQKGISFTNFYAPIYQSATADTEFISQTSLIPSIDGAPTAYAYQNNHYTGSLASLFNEKGYISNSFHSYYRVFYNREQLHESMGFSAFYDKDMLGITFPEGYEDGINWPSDEELMWRMMKKVDTEPFYHFVVTASGHMPYVGYRPEYEADYYRLSQILTDIDDEMLSYYASQSLLDRSIQTLLTILEEENLLENTVIILYGDHYPYGLSEEKQQLHFEDGVQKYKVPFIIYCDSHEFNLEIDRVCSTFDLLPTLSNMFELNVDNYYVGKDIFSEEQPTVYFYDRSWMNEQMYYDSTLSKAYDETGAETTDYKKMQSKVNEVFEMSQKMLELDYFGK